MSFMNNLLTTILLLFSSVALLYGQTKSDHKEVLLLMGSRFEFTANADTEAQAKTAVGAGIEEVKRIESLISSWDSLSQTSEVNRNAGIRAIKVDLELFELISRAIKISELTDGAFDISFAGIDWLYTFDKSEQSLPSKEQRLKSIEKIDYRQIELNRNDTTVFLKTKDSKIGFGGIGKGYAANRSMHIMKEMTGIKGGLVNASGDLIAWGDNGKSDQWKIQISNPEDINQTFGWLELKDMSIVTSGDYERYFTHDDIRYAHIINPRTGLPTTGIKSVSIISPDAEIGDALATSVFVLGREKGLDLIDGLKNIEALIIDDQNEIHYSKNLKLNEE